MQFRIAHNLVDVPAIDHMQTYNIMKYNAAKFRARTVASRHGFFPDVTPMWCIYVFKNTISSHDEGPCLNKLLYLYISGIALFFNVLVNILYRGIHIYINI